MNETSYNTIKAEIESVIFEYIEENNLDPTNDEDVDTAREAVTNEPYYVIGYWQCEQWLVDHDVTPWQAIAFVNDYEKDHFGESRQYKNAETVVNMIAYIIAWDVRSKEIA